MNGDTIAKTNNIMGFTFQDVINDPVEGEIVIVAIVAIPLCIVATILRLVATKRSGRKFAWDDLFAVLALLGFLVYAVAPLGGESRDQTPCLNTVLAFYRGI